MIVILIVIIFVATVAYALTYKSPPAKEYNPVVDLANSDHLPPNIVNIVRPLGVNATTVDSNTAAVINELAELGNYTNSPIVSSALVSAIYNNKINSTSVARIQDIDQDYILNKLEMTKCHTDPTNMYTSGLNLDDFNAIFTYGIDPHNQTAVKTVLANIPKVVARHWNPDDGGFDFSTQKYVDISTWDPKIQDLAKKAEIKWSGWNSEGKIGNIYVDGQLIWNGGKSNERSVDQPSYYFTHGRTGNCVESTITDLTVLKLIGYKVLDVGSKIPVNKTMEGHESSEVYINGKVYVVNFNNIVPREGFYEKNGWVLDPGYDPNWYMK